MLKTSTIHRKLNAKFKIGGIDAADLLSVLLCAAIMNLFFGRLSFGPIFIFGFSAVLFFVLYFGKKGKPDGYLFHAVKYYLSPGELRAGHKEEITK